MRVVQFGEAAAEQPLIGTAVKQGGFESAGGEPQSLAKRRAGAETDPTAEGMVRLEEGNSGAEVCGVFSAVREGLEDGKPRACALIPPGLKTARLRPAS